MSTDTRAITYRPEVDGLRAVAVTAVVMFHLGQRWMPGGYLGVDIFFVLSGFLITAIIWRDAQAGSFSIVVFYDRRIRRIMPALLVMLSAASVAALLLLLPADLVSYGKSLLATLSFSANVYFWRDTNYFSAAALHKPLLHIWSLGVEEQFYLLFPFLLMVLVRWCPTHAMRVIAAATALSLFINMVAVLRGGEVPAFFLLPTRAWELGAGALVALLPEAVRFAGRRAATAAWLGACCILPTLFHPLKSYWFLPTALPVVAGTAMLLMCGRDEQPSVIRWLQCRWVVFLGLISYSLYLWHWPIIVFAQYYLVRTLDLAESAAASVLMAVCAILSWRFVERPFRGAIPGIGMVRLAAATGALLLGTFAAALMVAGGFPGRLDSRAAALNESVDTNYRCPISAYIAFGASRACVLNLPTRRPADADAIILGNSHAQMYAPVWGSILQDRGWTAVLVPANGCLPTVVVNISRACIDVASRNLRAVSALARPRVVIVGLNWAHGATGLVDDAGRVVDDRDGQALVAPVDDLIDRLRAAGKRVILIGPIAEPGWEVASTLSREIAFGHVSTRPIFRPAALFRGQFGGLIRHFAARRDIGFARPDRVQCPFDRCEYVMDGRSLFSDGNHIAAAELPRFRAIFLETLRSTLPD